MIQKLNDCSGVITETLPLSLQNRKNLLCSTQKGGGKVSDANESTFEIFNYLAVKLKPDQNQTFLLFFRSPRKIISFCCLVLPCYDNSNNHNKETWQVDKYVDSINKRLSDFKRNWTHKRKIQLVCMQMLIEWYIYVKAERKKLEIDFMYLLLCYFLVISKALKGCLSRLCVSIDSIHTQNIELPK